MSYGIFNNFLNLKGFETRNISYVDCYTINILHVVDFRATSKQYNSYKKKSYTVNDKMSFIKEIEQYCFYCMV